MSGLSYATRRSDRTGSAASRGEHSCKYATIVREQELNRDRPLHLACQAVGRRATIPQKRSQLVLAKFRVFRRIGSQTSRFWHRYRLLTAVWGKCRPPEPIGVGPLSRPHGNNQRIVRSRVHGHCTAPERIRAKVSGSHERTPPVWPAPCHQKYCQPAVNTTLDGRRQLRNSY
jgi:hypothetical protein